MNLFEYIKNRDLDAIQKTIALENHFQSKITLDNQISDVFNTKYISIQNTEFVQQSYYENFFGCSF